MVEPQPRSDTASRTIAEQVARQLRKQIILGQLAPGEHLKEVRLAEQFDVSRSTIREVLRRLEGENLVEMISHRGARIAQFGPGDAVEIYELHAMLEEYSIRHVPLPLSAELVERLTGIVAQMKRLTLPEDVDLFIDLDNDFHETLMRAANRRQVYRVWLGLKSLHGILVGVAARHGQSNIDLISARHQHIIDALRQDDHDVAAAVIGDHYRSMAEQLRRRMAVGSDVPDEVVADGGAG
jgi:DNA-binding GntR family transcriptional regulator